MKPLNEYTKKEFQHVPYRESWREDIGVFDSLVIIPCELSLWEVLKYKLIEWMKHKFEWFDSWYLPAGLHDSGYRCMDFVACKDNEPICRLSGCSDVVHLNGIGGYGNKWLDKYGEVPKQIPPIDWSIDCLRTSGYLRLFCHKDLKAGPASSSFELYVIEPKQED